MTHRKRLGTSGGSNMAAPAPSPALHATESRDQKSLPSRPRPVRYPKESHGRKPLPRPSKAQYSPPKRQEVSLSSPEPEVEVGVVKPQYYNQPEHKVEVGVVKPQYYSQPEQDVEVGGVEPQYYSQPEQEVQVGGKESQYYSQPEQEFEDGGVEPQYYSQPEQELEEGGVEPQYYSQPQHEVEVGGVEPQYYSQPEQEVEEEGAELQYCSQPEEEVEEDRAELHYCSQPEEEVEVAVVEPQYRNQPEPELEEYRPLTPPTQEHDIHVHELPVHELPVHELPVHELPVHELPTTFDGADDSLDDDSSSDYMNNTSEDEEEYDEGLAEEDEGVTYYIRYCPEDDSYLEAPEGSRNKSSLDPGNPPQTGPQDRPTADPRSPGGVVEWVEEEEEEEVEEERGVREEEWAEDEEVEGDLRVDWREEGAGRVRQPRWAGGEGGEEWGEGEVRCEVVEEDPDQQIYEGRPEPILDHHCHPPPPPPPLDTLGGEEEEPDYCPRHQEDEEEEDGYHGDYYAPEEEDNGNSLPPSLYDGCRGAVPAVEGPGAGPVVVGGDDAEEDIDLIVAEIKMSMSMGSLSGSTDQSPEEPGPAHYQQAPPPPPPPPPPHRHDGRPKSLNLPAGRHNNPELQRGCKAPQRSPAEEQQRWAQEQVNNRGEGPRRQQRSDLNVPLENNNVPESQVPASRRT
ncbi:hypothetical protein CRUP_004858 [Coryphaenoides rupestris]|nr:hypothetical protein CRUP_004858 [Coryphaenoides rupestris]